MREDSARAVMARRQEPELSSRAFVVLLRGQQESARVACLLGEVGLDGIVAVPPVRGLAFFADPCDELDAWWGEMIPRHSEPVYILGAEPGIPHWSLSVDGLFVVGVDEPADVTAYAHHERIRAVNVTDAVDYVITIAREFGGLAASVEAASLLGQRVTQRGASPPRQRASSRFRRARLDASTELLVAVPDHARPVAPRQLLVSVDDELGIRGSEAFFTPTAARPLLIHDAQRGGDKAAVAS